MSETSSVTSIDIEDGRFVAPIMEDDPPVVAFFKGLPDVRKLFECDIFRLIPGYEDFEKKLDEIGVVTLIISIAVLIIASIVLAFVSAPVLATTFVTIQIVSGIIGGLVLGSFAVRYFFFREKEEEQRIVNTCARAFERSIHEVVTISDELKDTAAHLNATATTHKAANLDQVATTKRQKEITAKLQTLRQEHAQQQELARQHLAALQALLGEQQQRHDDETKEGKAQATRFSDNNRQLEQTIAHIQDLLRAPDELKAAAAELQTVKVNLQTQQEILEKTKHEVKALSRIRKEIDALLKIVQPAGDQ